MTSVKTSNQVSFSVAINRYQEFFEKFVPKFDYSAWGEGKYQSYIDNSIKITVDDEYDIKKNKRPRICIIKNTLLQRTSK